MAIVINTVTLAVQVRPRPSSSHVGTVPPASAPFCLPMCLLLPVTSASQAWVPMQNPGNQFDYDSPWLNPFLEVLDLVLTTIFTCAQNCPSSIAVAAASSAIVSLGQGGDVHPHCRHGPLD